MALNSASVASLQSEYPASLSARQYFIAFFHLTSLPLSFAAHIMPVDGSIQKPRI
jgi:hypothetical protein